MATSSRRGIYLLVLIIIIVMVLIVFRDRIAHNPMQQHIAESNLQKGQAEVLDAVKLSQRIQNLKTQIHALRRDEPEASSLMKTWSNREQFLLTCDTIIIQLDELSDQLNAMITNKNFTENQRVRNHLNSIQIGVKNIAISMANIIAASKAIQEEKLKQ